MNKIVCMDCGAMVRSGVKFVPGQQCSCGGTFGIHIKGSKHLYSKMPVDTVRIPRRFRPVKKSGAVKNQSAIKGARTTSSGAKI